MIKVYEVKTRSPFGYEADEPADKQWEFCQKNADIVSIHTDPRWGGSWEHFQIFAGASEVPVLAKGMHDTKSEVEKAFEFGADHVLVTGDGWDLYDDLGSIWAEPHTIGQLHVLRDSITGVWNSRNLDDGSEKQISFDTAREEHSGALIQASMIETVEDVHPEADGVLVGQHKRKFERTIQEHGILPDEGEGSDE